MKFRFIMLGIIIFSLFSSSALGNVTLSNFHTPTINPGESGKLSFTVENNYDAEMKNVFLTVEIYKYATEETLKNTNEISEPPVFVNGETKTITYNESITAGDSLQISLQISTSKQTPQGTYLVRMEINFTLSGTPYTIKSIGYFSEEERMNWELNPTDILIEPSFTVREPIPMWPLYVLIGAAVFFGALAVVFYMQDKGTLPKLKR